MMMCGVMKAAHSPALCAEVRGVHVHATAAIDGRDRPRLLRLCRYIARPPLAQTGTTPARKLADTPARPRGDRAECSHTRLAQPSRLSFNVEHGVRDQPARD
jgi:hypothetical protein